MTAPIALFVYNRLEHTTRAITSLAYNKLAAQSHLYIFSDGAKPGQEFEVAQVRKYLREIPGALFASINIYQNKSNAGCARSVIQGVSQIFQKHEKIIVVEDDLIVAPNFLDYMNAALEYYEGKNKWSVSGWGMNLRFPDDGADVWYSPRGSSWGWATWRKRWQGVDWSDYAMTRAQRKHFAEGGADLPRMLAKQAAGKINSWSIRFDYAQSKTGLPTVYPKVSKVLNVGTGGTHMDIDPGWPVTLDASGKTTFNFNGGRSEDLDRQFLQYFGLPHRIKNRLRNLL